MNHWWSSLQDERFGWFPLLDALFSCEPPSPPFFTRMRSSPLFAECLQCTCCVPRIFRSAGSPFFLTVFSLSFVWDYVSSSFFCGTTTNLAEEEDLFLLREFFPFSQFFVSLPGSFLCLPNVYSPPRLLPRRRRSPQGALLFFSLSFYHILPLRRILLWRWVLRRFFHFLFEHLPI